MGTSLEEREDQVAAVLDRLYDAYPDSTISLNYTSRFELLVAVVLSAQCTDKRVNATTPELFEEYSTPEEFANADQDELAERLNSITYYNNKAGYLRSAAQDIVENHGGEVPDTMSALTDLSGVGRKTANVVLQHGHDVVEGVVVDTHVQRLSRRVGLTDKRRPVAIESDLMDVVPKEDWQQFTHLFIDHGRATCTAQNPDCEECVLEDLCPSSKLDSGIDLASGEEWS